MKKYLCFFMSLLFVMWMIPFNSFAVGSEDIIYLSDGSYFIVITSEKSTQTRAVGSSKQGSRSYDYYAKNGEKQWTVTLYATFTFDGTKSACTKTDIAYSISDDSWKVTSATSEKNGNIAIGNFTVKRYTLGIPIVTKTPTVTLTCSKTGVLS